MLLYTVRALLLQAKDLFLELLNILLVTHVMLIMLVLPATFRLIVMFIPEKNCTAYVHM